MWNDSSSGDSVFCTVELIQAICMVLQALYQAITTAHHGCDQVAASSQRDVHPVVLCSPAHTHQLSPSVSMVCSALPTHQEHDGADVQRHVTDDLKVPTWRIFRRFFSPSRQTRSRDELEDNIHTGQCTQCPTHDSHTRHCRWAAGRVWRCGSAVSTMPRGTRAVCTAPSSLLSKRRCTGHCR